MSCVGRPGRPPCLMSYLASLPWNGGGESWTRGRRPSALSLPLVRSIVVSQSGHPQERLIHLVPSDAVKTVPPIQLEPRGVLLHEQGVLIPTDQTGWVRVPDMPSGSIWSRTGTYLCVSSVPHARSGRDNSCRPSGPCFRT